MPWPRSSPDLNPLDFGLWSNVNLRMEKIAPRGDETAHEFKARLRSTALSTPRGVVRRMIDQIRSKAQEIYEAGGGNIRSD